MVLGDVRQEVVVGIAQLDALHGDRHHLCARSLDSAGHKVVVVELSCSQKQTRVELTSSYYQFIVHLDIYHLIIYHLILSP